MSWLTGYIEERLRLKAVDVQRFAPTTGQTITIAESDALRIVAFVEPTTSLLALTINYPAGSFDGQMISVIFSSTITTITASGSSLLAPLGSSVLGTSRTMMWNDTISKWS